VPWWKNAKVLIIVIGLAFVFGAFVRQLVF